MQSAAMGDLASPLFATPLTDRPTYGDEVARLARLLGFESMLGAAQWQNDTQEASAPGDPMAGGERRLRGP